MRLALMLMAALAAPAAMGASATEPHPHQGKGTKFTDPPRAALSAADLVRLKQGKAVRKQVVLDSGGRGISVMDVRAEPGEVWAVIIDYAAYPEWIEQAEEAETYRRTESEIFVRFLLEVFTFDVEYYIRHVYEPEKGRLTWSLDYTKRSDFDDSTGYWLVYPAPDHPGFTRVEYSVDLRLMGWVPGIIESMLADKGLEQATTWVKKQAEG